MSNIIEIADDKSEIKIRDDLLCTFPATGTGGNPIYFHDLDCLEKDKWLSDQIISKFFFSWVRCSDNSVNSSVISLTIGRFGSDNSCNILKCIKMS